MTKAAFEGVYKKVVLKNFAIFRGKHLCRSLFFNFMKKRLQHRCFPAWKFLRTPILKNSCWRTTAFRKWLFETLLLDSRFQNHPDSVALQKYRSPLNQSFKHNPGHISSLNLTPTLPFEPRLRLFIINNYYTKSKPFSPWTPC